MGHLQGPNGKVECGGCGRERGELYTELDRLAFALEMEAAELVRAGESAKALRLEYQRLGVRLAQRLVADVWADEAHARIRRWRDEYEARLDPGEPVGAGVDAE